MDWIVGYGAPPDQFLKKVQNALTGTDTYKALNDRYAKEPNNVGVVFKLAQKLEGREPEMAKTKELYRKVVSLDPDGRSGSYYNDYLKASITYTEAAEEALGRIAFFSRENDPVLLRAFIAKYPESKFLKDEYELLARFYYLRNSVPKDEAAKFFAEYSSKYPYDADALNSYVERIIIDKEPLDKGIELAEKIKEITKYPRNPEYTRNLARLYVLKGDGAKAKEEYGKDFIESCVSSFGDTLMGYSNFWIEQGKDLESVEAMADLAAGLNSDQLRTDPHAIASVYLKLKKDDKALAIYGPAFAKKYSANPDILASYAFFWNRQGKNLESALEAVKRAVELSPKYSEYYMLGQILFKVKNYPDALKAAEKAVELVKPMAANYKGFSTQQYDNLVKDIKDAIAKEKGGEVKK